MAGDPSDTLTAAAKTAFSTPFAAVIELAPEGSASLFVDGRKAPVAVSAKAPKDKAADCVWRGAEETLLRVLEGERALESAYLSGRIAIVGDMSVMARLVMETSR